jgi:class 3 adenylate cyclase
MALPSGTITFLFTDIEASTALLKQLGGGYDQVLTDHRLLLEESFEAADGRVVDTQGDAFFVAFSRAHDAVAAAVHAQQKLASHRWPASAKPRVRMGIHTGEPSVVEAHLIGLSVHRAARICAAGHGGQILLSSTTRDLVEERLPPGMRLVDLGEHRLKDIDRPERIAQVVIDGLPPVFTPLKSLDAQSAKATPFEGEEGRLAGAAQTALEPMAPDTLVARARLKVGRLGRALPRERLSGRQRGSARAMEAIGFRIHASARIAPTELRADVAHLGGAVAIAARVASEADKLVTGTEPKVLARRLRTYRESAPISEWTVKAAEAVARQLTALDTLQKRRRAFEEEAKVLEPRLKALVETIFQSRLDHEVPSELGAEVSELQEVVHALALNMQEACDRLRREQLPKLGAQ